MWIARCSDSHRNCQIKKLSRPPSRLISIGSNQDDIKLVIVADLEDVPPYSTLSYCWGSEPFTMLTETTLSIFTVNIPRQTLPLTFLDAITATRQLNLSYIWIDALCIIQNQANNTDWKEESGHMRSIYGGGHVNLAVSNATTVHQGFLRRPAHQQAYTGGFLARVTTIQYCAVQNFYSGSVREESTALTHLATRAWAFQEKLLPCRTISFCDTGLFWECRDHIASESLPDGFPDSLANSGRMVIPEDSPWSWEQIAHLYSKTKLSYSPDRLPALSGIVARQHNITGDQYLAGLWRESIIVHLPWTLLGAKSHRPKWRAPTWSWMSIDGEVRLPHAQLCDKNYEFQAYVQLLEAWTLAAPPGTDPYGAVTAGQLTLATSLLVRGHISTENSGCFQVYVFKDECGRQLCNISVDYPREEPHLATNAVYLLPAYRGRTGTRRSKTVAKEKNPADQCKSETTERRSEEEPKWYSQWMCKGLVLQRCENSNGHFERIGCFNIEAWEDDPQPTKLDRFTEVLEKVGSTTAAAECAAIESDSDIAGPKRYSITIE